MRKLFENMRLWRYVCCGLKQEWSPDEIVRRLKMDYPGDMTMRISAETIYQYIYVLPRGELKATLARLLDSFCGKLVASRPPELPA